MLFRSSEDLCGDNGETPLYQVNIAELCRQPGGSEEMVLLLVEHADVINDDAVEEAEIDASYNHCRAKLLRQRGSHDTANKLLRHGNIDHGGDYEIKPHKAPNRTVDDVSESLQ